VYIVYIAQAANSSAEITVLIICSNVIIK